MYSYIEFIYTIQYGSVINILEMNKLNLKEIALYLHMGEF